MFDPSAPVALLLIDIQQGFDAPSQPPRNNPDAEANAADLLTAWRRAGQPIIHVQHLSTEPASPLRPGQPGVAFKPEVAPLAEEPVVPKHVNSAFIGTDLEARLRGAGISQVVIAGLTTDHCVSTTTRMAGNLGFRAVLAGDATATFDKIGPDGRAYPAHLLHDVSLASLHGEFAEVATTAEIIAAINVGSGSARGQA